MYCFGVVRSALKINSHVLVIYLFGYVTFVIPSKHFVLSLSFCALYLSQWVLKATMATTWDLYDSYCSISAVGPAVAAAEGEQPACGEVISSHRLDPSVAPNMSISAVSTSTLSETSTPHHKQHSSYFITG